MQKFDRFTKQLAREPETVRVATLLEVKSTMKDLPEDFRGMFFVLTESEWENANSIPDNYRFVLVSPGLKRHLTLGHAALNRRITRKHMKWSVTLRSEPR